MKYALVLLCLFGTLLGLFAGGCSTTVALFDLYASTGGGLLAMSVAIGVPAFAIMLVNVAIINALRRGQTERRTSFLALATLDLLIAFAVITFDGGEGSSLFLAVPLLLKGVLTFMLFRQGKPQQAAADGSSQSGAPPS